jgi:hypothetical protein
VRRNLRIPSEVRRCRRPCTGYASVAVNPERATELIAQVVKDFKLQGNELKGGRLLKHNRGRRAITWLADQVLERTQFVVHDKLYALAGKVFEYTFEPLISEINSLFYAVEFQKFIANMIYVNLRARNDRSRRLLMDFERAVREDDQSLRGLLAVHSPKDEDALEQIISFCVYNREAILRELAEVKKFGGWMLELTFTSLWSLLGYWGERFESLVIYCDDSVPIAAHKDMIDMMVGRTDKVSIRMGNRRSSLLFNLHEPVHLVNSKEHAGVQIADTLAAATCYAIRERRQDEWSQKLLKSAFEKGAINGDSILPDLDYVNPDQPGVGVNYTILLELNERSARGESLTAGMSDFVRVAYERYPEFARKYLND